MKKSGLILLLIVALTFCFSGGVLAADPWDGTTTDVTWYSTDKTSFEISTPAQLAGLASIVNAGTDTFAGKTITLKADLDLGGVYTSGAWDTTNSKNWTPIGNVNNSKKQFAGTFNGNGKTISNIYINSTSMYQGVFGYLSSKSIVENLSISSGSITSTSSSVGSIAGYCSGIILNCSNAATITGGGEVGGISGDLGGTGSIVNSFNEGAVSGTSTASTYIAGISSNFSSTGTILNCYNLGNISNANMYAGGITAYASSTGTISNCYNAGTVTASSTSFVGNVIGRGSDVSYYTNVYGLKTDTVNSSLVAMAKPANTTLESSALVNSSTLAGLASTLGSNFKAASGDYTYPMLVWQGGSYSAIDADGLAIKSVSAKNGTVTVVMNKALVYSKLDKSQFTMTYTINGGETQTATISSLVQTNNTDDTTVTLNFTALSASKVDQEVAISVAYSSASAVAADAYTIEQSNEWPAYGEAPSAGDGTAGNPYLLATAENLAWFAAQVNDGNTDLCAKLTADIDLSGKLWPGIGSSSNKYIGTFNGYGHVIENMSIDITSSSSVSNVGFFNYLGSGAIVKNLGIASGSVTVSASSGYYVGALCGYNYYALILNCFNNVDVSTTGISTVGGIAGYGYNGQIVNCYNSGDVSTDGIGVGGIVGTASGSSAIVLNAYNTGNVITSATISTYSQGTGGIVGSCYDSSTVSNVYSTGYVDGGDGDCGVGGGVIGMYKNSTINNCYYLHTILVNYGIAGVGLTYNSTTKLYDAAVDNDEATGVGKSDLKGLSATLGSGFVPDNDNINSGYPILSWQAKGADYPDDELNDLAIKSVSAQNGSVYVTLNKKLAYRTLSLTDFALQMHLSTESDYYTTSIKSISQDNSGDETVIALTFTAYTATTVSQSGMVNVSYQGGTAVEGEMTIDPTLEWYSYGASSFAGGDGSESDPYQIATAEQLVYLSNQVSLGNTYSGKYIVLTTDIDLGGKYWQPIGSYHNTTASMRLAFAGNFNGQGKVVYNLYLPFKTSTVAKYQYSGLFGWNTGTISNVTVTGLIQGYEVGGIAALNNGTVSNCTSYLSIAGGQKNTYYVGGIVGYDTGNISDCVNYGKITVGSTYSSTYFGGITGYVNAASADITISRCANYANIKCSDSVAGIAGCTSVSSGYKILFDECFNTGQMTAQYYCAGIAGLANSSVTFNNCYNTGNIIETFVTTCYGSGGISAEGGIFVNCYNAGALSGSKDTIAQIAGGVVEDDNNAITNCYYLDDGLYKGCMGRTPDYVPDLKTTALDASDMKATSFVDQLNGDDGAAFVADTNDTNNGYPILAWAVKDSTAPTGLSGGKNCITGLDASINYEYKNVIDSAYTSVDAGSTEITGLNSGTYDVRFAQTTTSVPSDDATITVKGELSGSASIPSYSLIGDTTTGLSYVGYNMYDCTCYVNTQGLPENVTLSYQWYRYDSSNDKYTRISGANERSYTPKEDDIGSYLYAEVYADGYDGSVSATTEHIIQKQKIPIPYNFTVVDCSATDINDGEITGLNPEFPYQYKLSTDSDYTAVAEGATEITGLAPGTYMVMARETDCYAPSSTLFAAYYTVHDFATSLATAQTAAKGDLTTALKGYTQTDYSVDNWTALNKAKTDGDTAIAAATTLADVATAKKTAIDAMAAVKNAIASAKEDAKAALDTSLGGYTENDYYAEQWTALNKAKTDGDTAIEAATDTATIDTAKQTALDAMAAVKTKATLDASSVNATVTVDAQSANSFLVPYQSVTVNSALAESYGYSDGVDIAQGVSTLDVLVKAHQICYGDDFDATQLTLSGSGIAKIFDVATYNCGFAVNGVSPHGDTLNESPWGNYYDGYALSQAQVSDNDQVEFFLYQDSSALDNYSWFEQSGAKTESITAKAGSDFSLTLKGYAIGWYGCSEASVITNKTTALEGAQLALVGSDGKITDIKNAVTGSDGSVTLKVSKEGSYLLTAYVPSSDIESGTTPLLMPIAALTITAADTVVDVKNMTDVKDGAWYYDSVAYVLANGIMYGSSSTIFDPDGNVTRGQFVTILGRYAGIKDSNTSSPATTSFADVNGTSYYAAHVAWAAANGITSGTSATTFDPNAKITRQDMAAMIVRFASVEGITLPNGSGAAAFADDGDIASYAKTAVYSMAEAKIINGVGNNKFSPKEYATRAQAATMIRLLIAYKG